MKKVIVCLVILCFGSQAFALTAVGSPSADDGWNSMFEDGVQQIYVSGNNQKFGREIRASIDGTGLDLATGMLHTPMAEIPVGYSGFESGLYGHTENSWSFAGEENQRGGTVVGGTYMEYMFIAPQELGQMWIWNYKGASYQPCAMQSVTIEYSLTGSTDPADWTEIYAGDINLNNPYDEAIDHIVDFGGAMAQFVVITSAAGLERNWWDNEEPLGDWHDSAFHVSEVRFNHVPEPATMLLLGLGGLVLRRRK